MSSITYQLKYCERCGSLRLRPANSAETYCAPCEQALFNWVLPEDMRARLLRRRPRPAVEPFSGRSSPPAKFEPFGGRSSPPAKFEPFGGRSSPPVKSRASARDLTQNGTLELSQGRLQ